MICSTEHDDQKTFGFPLSCREDGSPEFPTPEDWLAHFDQAARHGHRPWPPVTRDELLLADEFGLLEDFPQWLPGRLGLRLLNLPDHFGRSLEPYSERFRERFLSTLNADPEFASAVLNLIHGEG
ncbi:MAG: hypothetical protein R3C59_14570 [Planctomycetaceae bacterium]